MISGIILFKAFDLTSFDRDYQYKFIEEKQEPVTPEKSDMPDKITKEQEANRALVEELKATISNLEEQLSKEEKVTRSDFEPEVADNKSRVLAVLGGGIFRTGQVVITEDIKQTFDELRLEIQSLPDHRIVIEGHTDNRPIKNTQGGIYRDNMDLSFMRAKAVANILIEQGIQPERISVIGYGDTQPVASNETAEGRSKNRRAEVKITPQDKGYQ